MKKKIIIIGVLIMLLLFSACSQVDLQTDKNYIKRYNPNKETEQIINMLGNGNIHLFEYDAADYEYIEIYVERYEDGKKIDDLMICSSSGGNDDSAFSGIITITISEENKLRFAMSTDSYGSFMNTQFESIGAPTIASGNLMSSQVDRISIENENTVIPLLFVGYTGDEPSDEGYRSGLDDMSDDIAKDYVFCYRVVVKFTNDTHRS